MAIKIDHIGFTVSSLENALNFCCDLFGVKSEEVKIDTITERKVRVAVIPVDGGMIELMESTSPDGWIAKYINEHGEGLHHLALEVSDIRAVLDTLRERGVPLIDPEPRLGRNGSMIAFLNPESPNVLIELVEY